MERTGDVAAPTADQAAEELLKRRKAAKSLHEYIRQAWPQIEAGREFVDNWHIGAVTEHLQAVSEKQIRNLLINVPPRSTKSTLVGVAWPSWEWIKRPSTQWVFTSYAHPLSIRDSRKCRALIKSPWYQRRWGVLSSDPKYKIIDDSDTLVRFDNDSHGYRIATSTDSMMMGEGGDILCADDPNDTRNTSDTMLQTVLDWWTNVMPTRLNDFKTGRRVAVQQRVHEKDLSGHIMANAEGEWVHLMLPMEYEPKRMCVTVALPSTGGKKWRDPRTKEGELLDEKRVGPQELKTLKRELASEYSIAGQLQQRPAPSEGGKIKRVWFQWWKQPEPPRCRFKVQSWDTSLSETETSAYNAATTWGVFDDDNQVPNIILLSMWRMRCDYHELRKRAVRMADHYLDDGEEHNPKLTAPNRPDLVLIEDKGFGRLMIKDLQRAGKTAHGFRPDAYGNKDMRIQIASPMLEGGRVWVPAVPPNYTQLKQYADVFVEQCVMYPRAESRDLVDTMSQAILRLQISGFVWVSGDPGPEEPVDRSQKAPFY